MEKFAFLFPDNFHFSIEIMNGSYGWNCPSWKKRWSPTLLEAKDEIEKKDLKKKALKEKSFRYLPKYFRVFNKCINERYREKDFQINWVSLNNVPVSQYVETFSKDKIILSGVSYKGKNELSGYPNFSKLINEIGDCGHLRVGGHMVWDCVSKFAEEAHERGLDVLIDEDLTDFFNSRIKIPSFRTNVYPSINFKEMYSKVAGRGFEDFMRSRKGKPWFYQAY